MVRVLSIIGYTRSGSTLLDSLLGELDGVFSAGELITGPVTLGVKARFPRAAVLVPVIGPGEAVARLTLKALVVS